MADMIEPEKKDQGKESGPLGNVDLDALRKEISEVPPAEPRGKGGVSGRRSARKEAEAQAQAEAAIRKEMEGYADILLDMADSFCADKGLQPVGKMKVRDGDKEVERDIYINPLQRVMIKTGLVGTALKYNIELDDYPETTLLMGTLWVIKDKHAELKQLKERKSKPNDKNHHRKETTGQNDSGKTPN